MLLLLLVVVVVPVVSVVSFSASARWSSSARSSVSRILTLGSLSFVPLLTTKPNFSPPPIRFPCEKSNSPSQLPVYKLLLIPYSRFRGGGSCAVTCTCTVPSSIRTGPTSNTFEKIPDPTTFPHLPRSHLKWSP